MKIYSENEDYFFNIDDEKKAYWLGFVYADRCVTIQDKKKYGMTLMLHPKDEYILELFLKDIQSDRKVKRNKAGYVYIRINGKRFVQHLINLGCVPRKSNILRFPSEKIVPQIFMKDFVRGYMDGDGCISVYARERNNLKQEMKCEIKFIGTVSMIDGIRKFFNSSKKILINKHSPTTCQISFAGRKYEKVIDSLYIGADRYLTRKKEKWDFYRNYMYQIDNNIITTKEFIIINRLEINKRKERMIEVKENKKSEIEQKIDCKEENVKEIIENKLLRLRNIVIKKNKLEEKVCIIDNKNWNRKQKNKIVEQYTLEGKLIKVWESAEEAAKEYSTTSKAIRKVCTKERKTCKGYVWKYRDMIVRKECQKIYQYTMEGIFIKKWESVLKAAEYYEVTEQAIRRAVTGKYKSSCGFIWKK